MAFDGAPLSLAALATIARSLPLAEALQAFGQAVTGTRGFLASGGFAILTDATVAEVLGPDGRVVGPAVLEQPADPSLAALGLRLARVPGAAPAAGVVACVALRAGLLCRMLDMAHEHLKPRTSFGQRTLMHQLVKACFARTYATATLVLERVALSPDPALELTLEESAADHEELTTAGVEAEKLMGGHGYLAGGTHDLAYLSLLLHAIYGRAS